jgi:hypothetical protein
MRLERKIVVGTPTESIDVALRLKCGGRRDAQGAGRVVGGREGRKSERNHRRQQRPRKR